MIKLSFNTFLNRITPKTGLPFPTGPKRGDGDLIAEDFEEQQGGLRNQNDSLGYPVIQVTDEMLGRYEFMPVVINDGLKDYFLPNAVIMISGEKAIIETDVIDRGTVFEKVYERPYDISIIVTLHNDDHTWPAEKYKEMAELYRGRRIADQGKEIKDRDLVTLRCALTAPFLTNESNFLITKIAVLDNEYSESTEVIQLDGRSNIEFQLVIA